MRRAACLALLCAACLGPRLASSSDGRATVWFSGKEGVGYVTQAVMEERTAEAEAFARHVCDGGIEVTARRSDGRDNWLDVTCLGPRRP